MAIFGGTPKGPQGKELKKKMPQVLVATPGRLQDFMSSGEVNLSQAQLLVLDEADRMLDMGFEPEIAKILSQAPPARQTLLFTATWPKAVKRIAEKYLTLRDVHVNVGETEELAANKAVSQEFFRLGDDEKDDKLWQILSGLSDDAKAICFANTKRRIDSFQKTFWSKGFDSVALHGDKPQKDRDRDLEKFTKGECWLMFATDDP
ncbi:DEAD-box ATP-dependent RNA helicase 40 [Durusdinium trenchii]|uniref:RNA helicase n=1 Tax=Durusdinium trenchii TaxID=1381693 RepID=A0ABP0JFG2_9DINO